MPHFHFLPLLALAAKAMATHLFVTDYSGTLTTLKLENSSLTAIHTNTDCGPSASWLTIDNAKKRLYCLNEAAASATANGTLVSYSINSKDGSLTKLASIPTINGPVSAVLYGPGTSSSSSGPLGIALAHYGGSAVSTFLLSDSSSTLKLNEAFTFSLSAPGPNADRQDAPHPHEALLDPTGQYLLVPDLGADLVRVFAIDAATLKLTAKEPLKAAPGSGPRHAAFWKPQPKANVTFFYLVAELGATVTGYEVAYLPDQGGLNFTEVQILPTMGNAKPKNIVAPAEVTVSVSDPLSLLLSLSQRLQRQITPALSSPITATSSSRTAMTPTPPFQLPAAGTRRPNPPTPFQPS